MSAVAAAAAVFVVEQQQQQQQQQQQGRLGSERRVEDEIQTESSEWLD